MIKPSDSGSVVLDKRTNTRTDGRKDGGAYRDARTHKKEVRVDESTQCVIEENRNIVGTGPKIELR